MAVVEQKDPRSRKTFLEAAGFIKGAYLNEIPEAQRKTYPGEKGQVWAPTHRINLVIGEDRISLGLFEQTDKKKTPRAKDTEGNYHDLAVGAEVSVVVTRGDDYNGKPQYSARLNDVLIVTPAPVKDSGGGAAKEYKPKDMTGVRVGHAVNAAINTLGLAKPEELIEAAKEVHDLTEKLVAEYKEKNPKMSEYDLGASVGQAILSASRFVDSVQEIEAYARATLDVVAPAITEYIKGAKEDAPAPAPAPAAKPKGKAKAAPAPAPAASGFDDMDDDIPF